MEADRSSPAIVGADDAILVLHSGGLDSTVCLLMALDDGAVPISLGIDYGQRHIVEMDYARTQCERWGVRREVLKVRWSKPDREIPLDRLPSEMRLGSAGFLPGRNAVFLTLACAQAHAARAKEVWIGVNSVDYSGYPDCEPQFIDAFNDMISLAIPGGPRVVAPLQNASKEDIAAEAANRGVRRGDTWSCYRPYLDGGTARPCERCDACILHELAWSSRS